MRRGFKERRSLIWKPARRACVITYLLCICYRYKKQQRFAIATNLRLIETGTYLDQALLGLDGRVNALNAVFGRENEPGAVFDRNKFGVVVAHCSHSLHHFWPLLNCNTHEIVIYSVCGRKLADIRAKIPRTIINCAHVVLLAPHKYGKCHAAYLAHIVRHWNGLHHHTFFVKDNIKPYDRAFKASSDVGYRSLEGYSGRRGPAYAGKSTAQFGFVKQLFLSVSGVDNVTDVYVAFGSLFLASASRIQANELMLYEALLRFVMEPAQVRSSKYCVSHQQIPPCCNCESMERLWGTLLKCTDDFTELHRIHQVKKPVFNPIAHKTCYDGGSFGPILLQTVNTPYNSDVLLSGIVSDIYLAFLLRWNLVVLCHDSVCDPLRKFIEFTRRVWGVQILTTIPPSYAKECAFFKACTSQQVCTYENIITESHEVTGNYMFRIPHADLLKPSGNHGAALKVLEERLSELNSHQH